MCRRRRENPFNCFCFICIFRLIFLLLLLINCHKNFIDKRSLILIISICENPENLFSQIQFLRRIKIMPAKFIAFSFFIIFIFIADIQANNSPILINERFTINALNTISGAQATFKASNPTFATFQQLRDAGLIDPVLATGEKYGYIFSITLVVYSPSQSTGFQVSAVPRRYGRTGRRSFYLDESGVIRGADRQGAPANADDLPIPVNCSGESGTINIMRNFNGAQATYYSSTNNYGTLTQLVKFGLVGEYLADGENCGYLYSVSVMPRTGNVPARFQVRATPQPYGVSGIRSFYIDETGVLRGADKGGASADADDPPIE